MKSVEVVCEACDGTGLYHGFAEAPGVFVICLKCNGSGCFRIHYNPFESRKERRGVKSVQRSRGAFVVTGVGAVGPSMTYDEFKRSVK